MRDDAVTICKAIAIILMVMAHARCPLWWQQFINMFHMPLFFFFSGYCFKEKYLQDAKDFAIKRVKGVYFPYVKYGIVFLLLHNIFYYLNIYNSEYGFRGNVSHIYTIKEFWKHTLLIITSLNGVESLLGGYWFLHSLFFGAFLFYLTLRFCKNPLLGGGILLGACFLSLYFTKSVPFFIGAKEFLAAFFIMAGFYYKRTSFRLCIRESIYIIPIALILLVWGTLYWQCGMLSLTWQKLLPYSFTAILGTLMVFAIAKIMEKKIGNDSILNRIILYVGNNTLDVLTWHFLSFKLVSLLIIWVYDLSILHLAEFPVIELYAYSGWWILYLIIGVFLPLIFKCFVSGGGACGR